MTACATDQCIPPNLIPAWVYVDVDAFQVDRSADFVVSEWSTRLESFADLPHGWNGYSAKPPSGLAIAIAAQICETFAAVYRNVDRIAPSVVGGIGMTCRSAKRKAYVEVYNDGRVYLLLSGDDCEPNAVPVRASSGQEREQLAATVRLHLAR